MEERPHQGRRQRPLWAAPPSLVRRPTGELEVMNHPPEDFTFTHVTAVAGVTSPLWLHNMSDIATVVLPIAGLAWLLLQAGVYIYKTFFKKAPTE